MSPARRPSSLGPKRNAPGRINRRTALAALAGTASAARMSPSLAETKPPARTGMGLVQYCCQLQRTHIQQTEQRNIFEPLAYIAHCQELGAGGVQLALGSLDSAAAKAVRNAAEEHGMYIEAIVQLPKDPQDVARFDTQMAAAAAVGALAARTTIIPGRRYENFGSIEAFQEAEKSGIRSLELGVPTAEKHRVPLAVENHKDQRNDARVALLEHIGSEYAGACVDTGNSIALLEDPTGTVQALAPYAFSVHLKDQALEEYPEGFLLGDVPLGQGALDLKAMVQILRAANPKIRFSLELITREALRVPVLAEDYWRTFPDLPGADLARTLRLIRAAPKGQLQYVDQRGPQDQLELERANIAACINYAAQELSI